jgi:hypothetical protein
LIESLIINTVLIFRYKFKMDLQLFDYIISD